MSDGPMNGAQAVMAQQAALAEARAHIVELETLLERALDPNDYGIIKGLRRMLYAHRDELGAIHHRHRVAIQTLKAEHAAALNEQAGRFKTANEADRAALWERYNERLQLPRTVSRP